MERMDDNTKVLEKAVMLNETEIQLEDWSDKNIYVGSDAIESGNKAVLQKRLKLAGMRWKTETAPA